MFCLGWLSDLLYKYYRSGEKLRQGLENKGFIKSWRRYPQLDGGCTIARMLLIQIFANTALYKMPVTQAADAQGEYYQITVKETHDNRYVVKEQHGWFDETKQEPVFNAITLEDKEYTILSEAIARHDTQVKQRVEEGFKYSCFLDFDAVTPRMTWRDLTAL